MYIKILKQYLKFLSIKIIKSFRIAKIYMGRISYIQYLGINIIYSLMILVFYQMFDLLLKVDLRNLLYCNTAQFLILTNHAIAFSISEKITGKNFIFSIIKPYNFLGLELRKAFLENCYKFIFIGPIFFLSSFLLGDINFYHFIKIFFPFVILFLISSIISNLVYSIIGLLGFWIKNIKYIIYFNMTLSFVLGGLLVPVGEYYVWLKYFCYLTPYPWIISNTAYFFAFNEILLLSSCLCSAVWILLLYYISKIIHNRIIQNILTNGI